MLLEEAIYQGYRKVGLDRRQLGQSSEAVVENIKNETHS